MSVLPVFEDEFLKALVESFRRRRKALSHKSSAIQVEKVREVEGNQETEKLEITLENYDNISVRLHVWADRWMWLDARKGSKCGWIWTWQEEGWPLRPSNCREIVEALEGTHDLAFGMEPTRTHEFSALWNSILARGPTGVR